MKSAVLRLCLHLVAVCVTYCEIYGGNDVCHVDTCLQERVDALFGTKKTESKGISAKLLFVQLVFRHGDRTPTMIYKNDPNPLSYWEEGLGMLTKLGRKQQYRLGKYLRNRYEDFSSFKPTDVVVTSSELDRALMSAASHLAGLFAPPKDWEIEDGLNWQPIPIQYFTKDKDKYLRPTATCPRAHHESSRAQNSPEGQRFASEHAETFNYMTIHSGEKHLDMKSACVVFDTIKVEKKYNLKVPAWIEPIWDEMTNVTNHFYSWFLKTPLLKRLRAGPLIGKLLDNMRKKIDGQLPNQKFHVFSSHDVTVAMALTALDVFHEKQPPYCATAVFELHEMTDGSHSLRLLYLNSTEPETRIDDPHILTIPGCSEFCPLEYVEKYVHPIRPQNWEEECKVEIS